MRRKNCIFSSLLTPHFLHERHSGCFNGLPCAVLRGAGDALCDEVHPIHAIGRHWDRGCCPDRSSCPPARAIMSLICRGVNVGESFEKRLRDGRWECASSVRASSPRYGPPARV